MDKYIKYEDIRECRFFQDERGEWILHADIMKLPAADVTPIRHGKWIEKEESFKYNYGSGTKTLCICNVCNYTQEPSLYSNYNYFNKTKYCPNCGAKMDGGQNE